METAFAGSSAPLHVLERYPELLLMLQYTAFTPYLLEGSNAYTAEGQALHDENLSQEMERFFKKIQLDETEILYVYGTGLSHHYQALKSWLKAKRERRLIFLEEELGVIDALLHQEQAEQLFYDPQVIIHFLTDSKPLKQHLEELIAAYPCDRIEVAAIASYQRLKKHRFQQIRMKLLRLAAVSHAVMTEALYTHKLLSNLLRNIKRWPGSFFASGLKGKFQGIPAIICGAGPSLQEHYSLLKTLEDRALIFAGGSTIAALSNHGIYPHLGLALDPNPEEFGRLKIASAFETPLIYASRLQPDVFNTCNGERGYLISDTGGSCERYFEQEMSLEGDPIGPELGPEAFSVTTLTIALAVEMGCNPILLDGIDLAYTGMQRYSAGVLASSHMHLSEMREQKKAPDRLLKRKDIHGHYVHTLVKWVMESECIAAFAKAHPECQFINVAKGGIGFPGIPNLPLEKVEHLSQTLDLRGLVHAQIQQLKMPHLKERIAIEIQEVSESLIRLGSIAQQMLEELERVQSLPSLDDVALPTGKMTILEIDFQEEKAFECLFPVLGPALDKLLTRAFYSSPYSTESEQRRMLIDSKLAKWKQWKEMIDAEIAVFASL
jgi:hypothetical protein